MILCDLTQGSAEWHRWRQEGLGSSDAPIIMDASPWKTRLELWREKTVGPTQFRTNSRMQRGLSLEPAARKWASEQLGVDFFPLCFQNPHRSWLRASLDGISSDNQIAIEIKCPGRFDHAMALKGQIPLKYQWQLVHQMLCTGLKKIWYVSYSPESSSSQTVGNLIEFRASDEQSTSLSDELDVFWKCCTDRSPPTLIVQ